QGLRRARGPGAARVPARARHVRERRPPGAQRGAAAAGAVAPRVAGRRPRRHRPRRRRTRTARAERARAPEDPFETTTMTSTDDDPIVRVEDLQKQRGKQRALDGVSFAIRRGSVFGLIGPNGAGKTTAIKILLGMLRPDAGRAEVFGTAPMD